MEFSNKYGRIVFIVNMPLRVIASITLAAFLFTFMPCGSGYADSDSSAPLKVRYSVDNFSMPPDLGVVKDSWHPELTSQSGLPQRMVVHIQDAHCNYDAQKKIAEIIAYLAATYGVNTINLEGGAGSYDTALFSDIGDNGIRAKVSDRFVRSGLMSGAEYFAINHSDSITLWGIEDPRLYLTNLSIYRDTIRHKEEVGSRLKTLNRILAELKIRIYSKELLDFDTECSRYRSGNLELKGYITYLIAFASEKDVDMKALSELDALGRLIKKESEIDFSEADAERDRLISGLRKELSRGDVEELSIKIGEFKAEKMSPEEFYLYLFGKSKDAGIDLSGFPELAKYAAYISAYRQIDSAKVMPDLDELGVRIISKLCVSDNERELAGLSRNMTLLKKIFDMALTEDDYRSYKADEISFSTNRYLDFINREAPEYAVTAELDSNIDILDRCREYMARFYEYSMERDEAFVRNIRYAVDESSAEQSPEVTVVVTGGFHTENLCELFRKNNISYVSIAPNFRNERGYQSPYFKLLAGNPYVEYVSMSRSIGIFTLAIASNLNWLGALGRELFPTSVDHLSKAAPARHDSIISAPITGPIFYYVEKIPVIGKEIARVRRIFDLLLLNMKDKDSKAYITVFSTFVILEVITNSVKVIAYAAGLYYLSQGQLADSGKSFLTSTFMGGIGREIILLALKPFYRGTSFAMLFLTTWIPMYVGFGVSVPLQVLYSAKPDTIMKRAERAYPGSFIKRWLHWAELKAESMLGTYREVKRMRDMTTYKIEKSLKFSSFTDVERKKIEEREAEIVDAILRYQARHPETGRFKTRAANKKHANVVKIAQETRPVLLLDTEDAYRNLPDEIERQYGIMTGAGKLHYIDYMFFLNRENIYNPDRDYIYSVGDLISKYASIAREGQKPENVPPEDVATTNVVDDGVDPADILQIFDDVRAPEYTRVFFIQLKDANAKPYHSVRADIRAGLKDEGFQNIRIVFYDGTEDGLERATAAEFAAVNDSKALALAFVDSSVVGEDALKEHNENNANCKWIREDIPDGVPSGEVFMRVVFGLAALDYVKNSADPDHRRRLSEILEKLVDNGERDLSLLRADFNNIFVTNIILILKKITKIDIGVEMHKRERTLREILTAA